MSVICKWSLVCFHDCCWKQTLNNSCASVSVPAPTLFFISFAPNAPFLLFSSSLSHFLFPPSSLHHPRLCRHSSIFSPAISCYSSTRGNTPTSSSSPIPFSSPSTPSYTPCCTPRRLSLSLSLAESSTNLRDSTKTTSTSLGLVHLLLEHGISASVYNPRSWDRGLVSSGASTPDGREPVQRCTDAPGEADVRQMGKRPESLLLQPSTPPNSPRSKSAASTTSCPVFQFSPSTDDHPFYDTFLASKPARTILREVLAEMERERGGQADDDSQTEMLNLCLVDKLKSFRTLTAAASSGNPLIAPFGSTGLGNSALGGGLPGLNAGLRRNRSYPAMVGASMAMKDPGGPPNTEILIPHTMQTPSTRHTQDMGKIQETGKKQTHHTLASKPIRIPQTLHALETVTPQTIIQRHSRPTSNDQHTDDDTVT